MREFFELGPTPYEETCVQVGQPHYESDAYKECRAFINQLVRQFGMPPKGSNLGIKMFPHDFGSYYEVVVYFDLDLTESVNYAYNIENNTPGQWDREALNELELDQKTED